MQWNTSRFSRQNSRKLHGFALPTVLIVSILMLSMLLVALQVTTAGEKSLRSQRYSLLARSAAESGVKMANACLKANDFTATWSTENPLTPSTDCKGAPVSSASDYVFDDNNGTRTTFTVSEAPSEFSLIKVKSVGKVESVRKSDKSVWKSTSYTMDAKVATGIIEANYVNSGVYLTCAIFNGETWCSGKNNLGQLGIGRKDNNIHTAPSRVVRKLGDLDGKFDKMVGVGNELVCIVTTDNEIYCAGSNVSGKLGVGNDDGAYYTTFMQQVKKPSSMTGEITHIAIGSNHVCVVSGGDPWCWGSNSYGQIGDGTTSNASSPTRVKNLGSSLGYAVSDLHTVPWAYHTCAVADSKAYCWGRNSRGQLGNNTTSSGATTTPQEVYRDGDGLLDKKVVSIRTSMGNSSNGSLTDYPLVSGGMSRAHTCALTSEGKVYCWGANGSGQLGNGTIGSEDVPAYSQTIPGLVGGELSGKTVIQISTAHYQSCALTQEGSARKVYCWGDSSGGKLGNGLTRPNMSTPTPILDTNISGKYITQLMGAVNRTCVIADNMSYCWGVNTDGQIGDGTTTNRSEPTEASMFRKVDPTLYY